MGDLEIIGSVAVTALAVGGFFVIASGIYPEVGELFRSLVTVVVIALVLLLATIGPVFRGIEGRDKRYNVHPLPR